ncbi:MAG: bifunctional (p)ppGpp synthetase/guanosine-3',5'-bis(diphosphate) 3'-pyrophosphohydrolase [Chloroflexi bacterium]|nr:bifunctional (p)ppGpp synthetase/guanosine-3',5'-bis(diphosphate) 3'-pyrophosphohydrolase [Chloroflexota bacterium]
MDTVQQTTTPVATTDDAKRVDELLAKARKYIPEDRFGIIKDAYAYAASAHQHQVRKSGEPFIEHPYQTALFLADLKLDPNTLAAALLHDVMEDCGVSFDTLSEKFGDEVARLVDGVTKLTKTELQRAEHIITEADDDSVDDARSASIRKMLMSMAEDVRVVLIKLADRLHNMRTLNALPYEKRILIAQETLDIYAPLAHRLGIWDIKWRLEDLSFQHLHPEEYKHISMRLHTKRDEREKYIERVRATLEETLEKNGIKAEVTGRPKHIYSIYKKARKYEAMDRTIDDIYDLFALRVLVQKVEESYAALGIIHTMWHPIPGQFDDYIANPKDNLYQSLHTTVLCEGASPVEVQIRTYEMHNLAEYGIAAHWLYKEGRTADLPFEEKMKSLRQLIEWQRDVSGDDEFVESFKTDIFNNQVFVYTPKGELKELPAGATPLDFAFRIHTDVGVRCIGGKVNGKLVPLQCELQNGDTVEILTSKTVRGPSLDWLNPNLGYLKTNSARSKVRQWFTKQERTTNLQRGKEIFARQIRRLDTSMSESGITELVGLDSVEDLFISLGNGTLTVAQLVTKLFPQQESKPEAAPTPIDRKSLSSSGIEVLGVGDMLTRLARCCRPIQGEKILGYITRSRGVTVHRANCANIAVEAEKEPERMIQVDWGKSQSLYPVTIKLEAYDRVGLLRDVTSLVSEERVNIASCVTEEVEDKSFVTLTVYINGIHQLNKLFAKLEGIRGVMSVARATA